MEGLHAWMIAQRDVVPEGWAVSRALDLQLEMIGGAIALPR